MQPGHNRATADPAEIHRLVLSRVYHEDILLTQRTYNFLTLNVFLGALAVLGSGKYEGLMYLLAAVGATLACFQIAFGRRIGRAIAFWREYLKLVEKSAAIPVDHLLFTFYEKGAVETPWGIIRGTGKNPLPVYRTFPWSWIPSTNTVIGVFVPWLILGLWLAAVTIPLLRLRSWWTVFPIIVFTVVTCFTWWWRVPALPKAEENSRGNASSGAV